MSESQHDIKVGIATEEQVNREFIDAWHRAQQGEIEKTEESLYWKSTITQLPNHSITQLPKETP